MWKRKQWNVASLNSLAANGDHAPVLGVLVKRIEVINATSFSFLILNCLADKR